MAELDLKAIEAEFLTQCGPCDFAMPGACECPERDYRSTMLDLVREVERLRTGHTQQALAASQADLTRACEERDEAKRALEDFGRVEKMLSAELASACTELKFARHDAEHLAGERDEARAELARSDRRRLDLDSELARARTELRTLREHQEIRAQVIRERNAELRAIRQALGIDMVVAPPDAVEMIRELRAAQGWIVAGDGGRNCERCEQEIRRGEAYEEQPGTGGLLQHIHCRAERDCSGGCHIVDCAVCRQPIRCDQPREPMPGAKGFYQHVNCPETEGATA